MIHHASLELRREGADAEVAFWALLGYHEITAPSAALAQRSRWLEHVDPAHPSRHQVHLVYEDEPTIPRRAHLAVVCPGYAATLAALRGAGLSVVEREPYWEAPRAFVHTPAGHRVEVMQFAPRG